jgi:hypothetical protein
MCIIKRKLISNLLKKKKNFIPIRTVARQSEA